MDDQYVINLNEVVRLGLTLLSVVGPYDLATAAKMLHEIQTTWAIVPQNMTIDRMVYLAPKGEE